MSDGGLFTDYLEVLIARVLRRRARVRAQASGGDGAVAEAHFMHPTDELYSMIDNLFFNNDREQLQRGALAIKFMSGTVGFIIPVMTFASGIIARRAAALAEGEE